MTLKNKIWISVLFFIKALSIENYEKLSELFSIEFFWVLINFTVIFGANDVARTSNRNLLLTDYTFDSVYY